MVIPQEWSLQDQPNVVCLVPPCLETEATEAGHHRQLLLFASHMPFVPAPSSIMVLLAFLFGMKEFEEFMRRHVSLPNSQHARPAFGCLVMQCTTLLCA